MTRRIAHTLVCVALLCVVPSAQDDLAVTIQRAFTLIDQSRLPEARTAFERALGTARSAADRPAEAEALRGLGTVLYQQGRWADAIAPLEQALAVYLDLGERLGEARALETLASVGAMLRKPDADDQYTRAEEIFFALGARVDQARVIRSRTHLPAIPVAEKLEMLERAYALADGDKRLQGLTLHSWGSLLQAQMRYSEALDRLTAAAPLLREAGTPRERARLLGTLGFTYSMHALADKAIEMYVESLRLLELAGDEAGQSQTAGNLAEMYGDLGDRRQAVAYRERQLAHAQKTGAAGMITSARGLLGFAYARAGDNERGIPLMEEALGRDQGTETTTGFYRHLARAYGEVGRDADAVRIATRGIELARERKLTHIEMGSLHVRAVIHERAGRIGEALADAEAGLAALERVRATLVPSDYLKSGFASEFQSLFGDAVALLQKAGRTDEAAAVAERGRARAFLDLLATTRTATPPSSAGSAPVPLTLGSRSDASSPPPTVATLRTAAARLGSTLLTYWVSDEATYIFVVTPSGEITSHRVATTRARLTALVRGTWSIADSTLAQRGIQGDWNESAAGTAVATPAKNDPAVAALTMRGGVPLKATAREYDAYTQLYALLVEPVRRSLPSATGDLITIVPHGPLLELSFAALRTASGRFLLEDYRLHYAPSAASLEFTVASARAASPDGSYLFVANPRLATALTSTHLPALPGALREVRAVQRVLGGRGVTELTGVKATEAALRAQVGRHRVVHFATHGLVSSAHPMDSFLALGTSGTAKDADGRLTAAEIYDLHLQADLVVLSACRAAGGRVSGDGILGLTRAFFSAGTPSIVAALWDVADESAEHLVPRFYAEWQKTGDKSRALRAAQLSMLRDLRAGKLTVQTPLGRLPLPPHPALWANLVLLGEPR